MSAAIISALSVIAGVVIGGFINFFLERSKRNDERTWATSEQHLRLYAEFLSLASRWQMEVTWFARRGSFDPNDGGLESAWRRLEELHRETLIPYGMIRMTSSPAIESHAQKILELCRDHQSLYEAGKLTEDLIWKNHYDWVDARTTFIDEARAENSRFLNFGSSSGST